tara:strand:- start:355 stop:519 length:165 start_codon:yes stop_codon:yes gene_type:complete
MKFKQEENILEQSLKDFEKNNRIKQAESTGLKGKFTENGSEIIDNLNNCRKVVF